MKYRIGKLQKGNKVPQINKVVNTVFPNTTSWATEPRQWVPLSNPEAGSPTLLASELIKKFEGYRSKKYLDGHGKPTIGYGATAKNYVNKSSMTEAEATQALKKHIDTQVMPTLQSKPYFTDLNNSQKAALISLTYNIGATGFNKSKALQEALINKDYEKAASEMDHGAKDKKNPGLKKRRDVEKNILLQSVTKFQKPASGLYRALTKEYDINSPEYRAAYNSGHLTNYDKKSDTYVATPLDGPTITAKRKYSPLEEWGNYVVKNTNATSPGGAMLSTIGAAFQMPQLMAGKLLTGKVQTPSEALNIKNPIGAFATDMVLDPLNLVGAKLFKNPLKSIKVNTKNYAEVLNKIPSLNSAKQFVKDTYYSGVVNGVPTTYLDEATKNQLRKSQQDTFTDAATFVDKWAYNLPAAEKQKKVQDLISEKFQTLQKDFMKLSKREKLDSLERNYLLGTNEAFANQFIKDPENLPIYNKVSELFKNPDYKTKLLNQIQELTESITKNGDFYYHDPHNPEAWKDLAYQASRAAEARKIDAEANLLLKESLDIDILDPTFKQKINNILTESNYTPIRPDQVKNRLPSEAQKLVYPEAGHPSFTSLTNDQQEYILKNFDHIGGFQDGIDAITLGITPRKITNTVKKSIPNPHRSAMDKILGRNSTIDVFEHNYDTELYHFPGERIAEIATHEGGHSLQDVARWGELLASYSKDYNYLTSNPRTEIGRTFGTHMTEPTLAVNGRHTHNTWLSSPNELHSELMSVRYQRAKHLMKTQGISMDQAIERLKLDGDEDLSAIADYPEIRPFFKPHVSKDQIKSLLKMLPSAGIIGIVGKNTTNNNK